MKKLIKTFIVISIISSFTILNYAHSTITNKTILVTAATGSLGKAICNLLASKKYNLIIAGRNKNKLKKVQMTLQKDYKNISIQTCIINFSDISTIESAAHSIKQQIHGIVLIGPRPSLTKDTIPNKEEWRKLFDETFIAPLEVLKLWGPKLVENSSIITIVGNTSKNYFPQFPNTNVIRTAWIGEIKNLMYFFSKPKIRVNAISPGIILTDFHKKNIRKKALQNNLSFDQQLEKEVSSIPLKTYGKVEDVAYLVAFLLSHKSSHINGANIILDGGETTAY